MAVSLVPFTPNQSTLFQFQTTLDGAPYTCVTKWNVVRIGWYFFVYDQSGVRVLTLPLVASPPGFNISLTAGYFTTPIVFRAFGQQFEIG